MDDDVQISPDTTSIFYYFYGYQKGAPDDDEYEWDDLYDCDFLPCMLLSDAF